MSTETPSKSMMRVSASVVTTAAFAPRGTTSIPSDTLRRTRNARKSSRVPQTNNSTPNLDVTHTTCLSAAVRVASENRVVMLPTPSTIDFPRK
jgi:hypothetical protein